MFRIIEKVVGFRSKIGIVDVSTGEHYGADLVVTQKGRAIMLINAFRLDGYYTKIYGDQFLKIPEDRLPQDTKLPATLFVFNIPTTAAYSIKPAEIRSGSKKVTIEGKSFYLVDQNHTRFYEVSSFVETNFPGESL